MLPDLQNLVLLQSAESELKQAETALADVPRRKGELSARLATERSRLEAARAALDESQRARRQHEGELQTLEAKRSKYKGQLMDVKTNKEYTAMLHEIEAVERDIRACEDQILVEMERAESLVGAVRHEETEFKQVEAAFKTEGAALDAEARRLEGEVVQLRAQRDQVVGTLSETARELFTRVSRLRGTGVSAARDTMCQACRMKLRPQMYMELKHNARIEQCPSCSRILYYDAPPPTVLIEP